MEVDPKLIKEGEASGIKSKVINMGGMDMRVFFGQHCRNEDGTPKYYDNYTECLYANINKNRNNLHKASGLDENAMTVEQANNFKNRLKITANNKKKAAVLLEAQEMIK